MLKTFLKVALALVLAFTAFLFYQATLSDSLVPETLDWAATTVAKPAAADVLTIAFGSCNRQDKPQDYWPTIAAHQPDAWLWLGDNIYSDTEDMDKMAANYAIQKNNPQYAAFMAAVPTIYGVWDDHDYGLNDGGKEWPYKAAAQQLLLDFLDVPKGAPVRSQEGAYQAYTIEKHGVSVRVILLDSRSFRDAVTKPTKKGHRYGENPTGTVIGEQQLKWLVGELQSTPKETFTVIASSIQVLPEDHGYEKWANFPAARTELLLAIDDNAKGDVLLLSGDRHIAEISMVKGPSTGREIYEITASGLTHSYEAADEPNSHRISDLIGVKNFGLMHFTKAGGETKLLAEVRGIEGGDVLASLAIANKKTVNKEALSALIHPNKTMPNELKPCPNKPNCVSTQATQSEKVREPIPYTGSMAEAMEKMQKVIGGMSRTKLINEENNYLHYTFKTFPIPFIDDVEFLFDDTAKVIHYRSASRVGHSDMGVNSKRMAKVVKAWDEQ
jgi:alkaline phosphatase D